MQSSIIYQAIDSFIWKELKENFFLKISLLIFVIIVFNFNESGFMIYAAFLLGLAFSFKSPIFVFRKDFKFPIEIKLLNYWILWSAVTGFFVAINFDNYLDGLKTATLTIATINLFFLILSYDLRLIKFVFFGVFISGLLQFLAIQFGFQSEEAIDKVRQQGLAGNPNSLGLKMVFASFAAIIALKGINKYRILALLIVSVFLIIFFNIILDSGSRKSAISFFVVLSFSIASFLSNRYDRFDIKRIVIIVGIIGSIVFLLAPILIEGTVLQERFDKQEENGGLEGDIRYKMYTFGYQLFLDNPLFGVGFDNYREYFTSKLYSHSDYIESLTSTGLIGFILYQLPFFIVIARAVKMSGNLFDKKIRFYAIMSFVGVVVIKVIGLGIILYNTSPSAMIIFASISTFTFYLKNDETLI